MYLPALLCCAIFFAFARTQTTEISTENISSKIEDAMFTRSEFFGVQAILPRPTAEARENVARLAVEMPENPPVLENLATLEENLSRFDEAEKALVRLVEIDPTKLQNLAAFYDRRARFADEAKVLAQILSATPPENKAAVLEQLIDLASRHDLIEYLQPKYFRKVALDNPTVFAIFERLIDRLSEERNYSEALDFLLRAKSQFPDRRPELLDREISILLESGKYREAEDVYRTAFDPFWTDEQAEKFYDFLNERDRLREYGSELKIRFRRNPADFDTAIRLADYRKHSGDEIRPVILKLEKAKKAWMTDELVTVTRLLIRENEGGLASRFLYTLYARSDFREDKGLRAKVLYQLFEMFSDAEDQKLPITKGDLRFYEEMAKTDTNPGITTGILSLIFSDSDPQGELNTRETKAAKYFNRAAAYRIFLAYKLEIPASPELGQMYLDIIRLYASTGETEIAGKALTEFAEKYRDSTDFPQAALMLAEALASVDKKEESRRIYQETLDYLGKQGTPRMAQPMNFVKPGNNLSFFNAAERTAGINIPTNDENNSKRYEPEGGPTRFHDYLPRKAEPVTYTEVLEKLVASLAKEKRTPEILKLYSDEIQKYPQAEWLYEQRLYWLEQTNLTEEQLTVYREAIKRFQSNNWSDKLARWFLRQNRQADFAELSKGLIAQLSDSDIQNYLSQFVDSRVSASDFDNQLYLQLYLAAHKRFPLYTSFVEGLLKFYKANKKESEWRDLAAEYYFTSPEIRKMFLDDISAKGQLRSYLTNTGQDNPVYKLFRADASIRLSNFEQAVDAYRELNAIYPNSPDFAESLIALTRSLGQKDPASLNDAANLAYSQAEFLPASAKYRTRSGEIEAEMGNYKKSREEWKKLIPTASGSKETYLETATVYWDYFQYEDAMQTIRQMRRKFADDRLCAFETGAIQEALHKMPDAIREYLKAIDSEDETQKEKAKQRLVTLSKQRNMTAQIEAAFISEIGRQRNAANLSFGFAEFLLNIGKPKKAEQVLNRAISKNSNPDFLESTLDFFDREELRAGKRAVLRRLAKITRSPRRNIKYRLELVNSFVESRERDSAKAAVDDLVRSFPTNYGVVTEASDIYQRIGFNIESVEVLRSALGRSGETYRTDLAARLSRRLIQLDRLDEAERILTSLHEQNKTNEDLFRELAGIYVRKGKPDLLRKAFDETVAALKNSDADRRELDDRVAELRTQMIDAFTRLRDYRSAVEQHIEIINRAPEDEELTDNAIAYVKRYGGGDTLLGYYQKTSAEAFKNYRWNVVLARIYEADGNIEKAILNYKAAIVNQPEMTALHVAVVDLETGRNNFDEALKNLDIVLELTNDAPEYVKKKIEILKKAGRIKEAESMRAKLPANEALKTKVDPFAAARELQSTEKEQARAVYKEAFNALRQDPLSGDDLKASNIVEYVQSMREVEPLDKIAERLWELREKIIDISVEANSTRAGEARKRLSIIDTAIASSIGEIAKTVATDEELAALHEDLKRWIDNIPIGSDQQKTLGVIQDISQRAGFGDLEELILRKRLDEAAGLDGQGRLRDLVGFYNERGAYERAFNAIEQYGPNDLVARAEAARLIGNRDKELESLRAIYWKQANLQISAPDANVSRYLQILYESGRDELSSLTGRSSAYQLQLINFLLAKGEKELAQNAIENASLPTAWKLSRHAETSLALKDFAADVECYFCDALQLESIGEMMQRAPDKQRFLVADDWFRLSREYGEWLSQMRDSKIKPSRYLAAMIENQPRSAAEQLKLGSYYLDNKDAENAVRHLRIAVELEPDNKSALAGLGVAYYLAGKENWSEEVLTTSIAGKTPADFLTVFQTMRKYGLAEKARTRLAPEIVEFLKNNNIDDSKEMQDLIRLINSSFDNDGKKAAYFAGILRQRPTDTSLAEMLVTENLIEKTRSRFLYERLIADSDGFSGYDNDYSFKSVIQRTWTYEDAEAIYDQENNYKIEEPENEHYQWERKYLELLLDLGDNTAAAALTVQIEKELKGRFARPGWLKLATLRSQIREGRFDAREVERFTGISVSDLATEINPPSLERLNDVLRILMEEKRDAEAAKLSEGYFARMLALGQFESANFTGLARSFFKQGRAEDAIRILRLMVDVTDDGAKENAMADIANLEIVKRYEADGAKRAEVEAAGPESKSMVLNVAAQIAAEFQRPETAIAFRRTLMNVAPSNEENRIELSKLLCENGNRAEAVDLLTRIISDRNANRLARWQARWQLHEIGENVEIPDIEFDSYSQFYNGLLVQKNAPKEGETEFFINALMADSDTVSTRQELIKAYALAAKPFAALKLAETDKTKKSDELLGLLSDAAERTGDFIKAVEFEKLKSGAGGNDERIRILQQAIDTARRKATDLTIDLENTRKL